MMILQHTHHIVDCPICGRPLEINFQSTSHEIACGHCRGEFTVYETEAGLITGDDRECVNLLERAEELLRATGDIKAHVTEHRSQRPLSSTLRSDHTGQSDDSRVFPLEKAQCDAEPLPTAVLVEQRDEVFARIANDMAEFGLRVVRAKSAREAMQFCVTHEPVLVVANVDLPDHSGWLLAGKLRFVDRHNRIWLYQTQSSSYDLGMVNFLKVDELLDYQGDLLGLSETIVDLMTDWHEQYRDSNNIREVAAA